MLSSAYLVHTKRLSVKSQDTYASFEDRDVAAVNSLVQKMPVLEVFE